MHDDRELLELAAKAAGIGAHPMNSDRFASDCKKETYRDMGCSFEIPAFWNPLTDDGDALRLAVKMGLTIDCDGRGITARKSFGGAQIVLSAESEYVPPDVNARMRRCIVRAAAAIGEAM